MARFEREAQMLAALNHPNIATVYGIEQGALVMELVEGHNLREPLPLDEAIPIARQIALGLEAAHERGIIHRDLKPANIRITPEGVVKLLDFGLAKSTVDAAASSRGSNPTISPTLSLEMTHAGMILGTAAYMAPEQARRKSVDKRADIWAFGVVLFEMLTGKKLFEGETVSDVLAAVLKEEPDLTRAPVEVRRLLRSCLKKDPRQRLHDISDAMLLFDDAPAQASKKRLWLWPSVAGVLAVALAAAALVAFRQPSPTAPVSMQFQIPAPENTHFTTQMALSPDGRMLAFTAVSDGINSLWVRPLDSLHARPLRQARPNQPFFWSFDSRFIAYNGEGKLTKIDVTGGPPQVVCDAPNGVVGGFWTKDDRIVFGQSPGPLMTVPASGGVPTPVAALDFSRSITNQVMPSLLPDGRHMVVYTGYRSVNGVFLTSFDARPGSEKFLVDAPVGAIFAASPDSTSGYLLFLRDSTLLAQPFDVANLALAGTAVPVAEGVGTYLAHGIFSTSNNGVLAYRTGSSGGLRLAWFDRSGKETGSVGPTGDYRALALSPDGARVATWLAEQAIWPSPDQIFRLLIVSFRCYLALFLGLGRHSDPWRESRHPDCHRDFLSDWAIASPEPLKMASTGEMRLSPNPRT